MTSVLNGKMYNETLLNDQNFKIKCQINYTVQLHACNWIKIFMLYDFYKCKYWSVIVINLKQEIIYKRDYTRILLL